MYRFLHILILLMFSGLAWGQDAMYSQFYNAPMHLNPAFAGNTFGPKLAINYRNQWPDLPWAYVTYQASFDQYFYKYNSGFGITVHSDDAGRGILKTNRVGLSYAYTLRVAEDRFLKLGFEPAIFQTRLNWNKLIFSDQIDGSTGIVTPGGTVINGEVQPASTNRIHFDLGAGGLFYTPNFYLGFSMKHLVAPNLRFIETGKKAIKGGLPIRYALHLGGQVPIGNPVNGKYKSYWGPQLLLAKQADFIQILVGSKLDLGMFSVGAWYRNVIKNSDAAVATFGIRKDIFRFEYSYDITISGLRNQGGAHEVGLVFSFGEGKYKRNYNDCFEIFR